MDLKYFLSETPDFHPYRAMLRFFRELGIPLKEQDENPIPPEELLGERYRPEQEDFTLVEGVWFLGLVDESLVRGREGGSLRDLRSPRRNAEGLAVFGLTLCERNNGRSPTRSQMAGITRAFSRSFPHFPVLLLFRYEGHICLASAERLPFRQKFREGERVGKVSLLRDICIENPHAGHRKILARLRTDGSGGDGDADGETLGLEHETLGLELGRETRGRETLGSESRGRKFSSFEELHNHWRGVFSVSLLNREFYQELSNWYFWAQKHVKFPCDGVEEEDRENWPAISLIRLITRLVFVWFLREKGLVPSVIFQRDWLKDWLKDMDGEASTYYRAILQNLFFATLNTRMGERGFVYDGEKFNQRKNEYGVKTWYRYADLFRRSPEEVRKLLENVPYLNGGLFECLDMGEPDENGRKSRVAYRDGFSRNSKKQAKVPNYLFFEEEEVVNLDKDYDRGESEYRVRGLINILSSYVFTVAENTALEEDVALEPELLGRAFENLLASYNPETQINARNRSGSFYTPREIVDYMVDESLKEYLRERFPEPGDKTAEPEVLAEPETSGSQAEPEIPGSLANPETLDEKLENLFSREFDGNPFNEEETRGLIKLIGNCRILDPACGSGAFPMGMLQNMVFLLRKLDPDNINWQKRQMERAGEESRAVYAEDKEQEQRESMLQEISNTFEENKNFPDYTRKLYLIENCIYGADIQPIAIQICKLRFFISLVVDQEKKEDMDNLGIRSLPNLETRFVAADSLMSLPEGVADLITGDEELHHLEEELREVRHRHFNSRNRGKKLEYQEKDHRLSGEIRNLLNQKAEEQRRRDQREMEHLNDKAQYGPLDDRDQKKLERLEARKNNVWDSSVSADMAQWNPYDPESVSPVFDPLWMFGMERGFDVVLGNPPYVQLQKEGGRLGKKYENEGFTTFASSGDIYCLFYERGLQLLCGNGILAYISSNKWMKTGYGKKLREYLMDEGQLRTLIDFGDAPIFDNATVLANIMIFLKGDAAPPRTVYDLSRHSIDVNQPVAKLLKAHEPDSLIPSDRNFIILRSDEARILDLMKERGVLLGKWEGLDIDYGIKTGYNEAFIINAQTRNLLVAQDPQSAEILKPILRGRDVKRYVAEWAKLWIVGTFPALKLDINDYPAVRDYLDAFRPRIDQSGGKGMRKNTVHKWFETQDSIAYYHRFEEEKIVYPNMTNSLPFAYDNEGHYINDACFMISGRHLKYLCGVLNSRAVFHWLSNTCPSLMGKTYVPKKIYFDQLPIPQVAESEEEPFAALLDYILFARRNQITSSGLPIAPWFEEIMDMLAAGVFFPEEMKKAECHINSDLLAFLPDFQAVEDHEERCNLVRQTYKGMSSESLFEGNRFHYKTLPLLRLLYKKEKKL